MNNGHRPDIENDEESSQEHEKSVFLDKNEKMLALLARKKQEAFEKLPKRKNGDESSQSQAGEMM